MKNSKAKLSDLANVFGRNVVYQARTLQEYADLLKCETIGDVEELAKKQAEQSARVQSIRVASPGVQDTCSPEERALRTKYENENGKRFRLARVFKMQGLTPLQVLRKWDAGELTASESAQMTAGGNGSGEEIDEIDTEEIV